MRLLKPLYVNRHYGSTVSLFMCIVEVFKGVRGNPQPNKQDKTNK